MLYSHWSLKVIFFCFAWDQKQLWAPPCLFSREFSLFENNLENQFRQIFESRLGLNEFFLKFLMVFHWIDPRKNSQNFVEKAHYPDATPLKISIRTHSIPAFFILHSNFGFSLFWQVTQEVEKRIEDLTHQVHREILARCAEQVKTLAPILICSMKIFIQIIMQGIFFYKLWPF